MYMYLPNVLHVLRVPVVQSMPTDVIMHCCCMNLLSTRASTSKVKVYHTNVHNFGSTKTTQ